MNERKWWNLLIHLIIDSLRHLFIHLKEQNFPEAFIYSLMLPFIYINIFMLIFFFSMTFIIRDEFLSTRCMIAWCRLSRVDVKYVELFGKNFKFQLSLPVEESLNCLHHKKVKVWRNGKEEKQFKDNEKRHLFSTLITSKQLDHSFIGFNCIHCLQIKIFYSDS